MKLHILALDLASTTGWARFTAGMDYPDCGSEKFDGPLGCRAYTFRDWLYANLRTFPIDRIIVEEPIPYLRPSLDARVLPYGMFWSVHEVAYDFYPAVIVASVAVPTWRSYFIGYANAPKSIPKKDRRRWLKKTTIAECQNRGMEPPNDDAADALGILYWCLDSIENNIDVFEKAA